MLVLLKKLVSLLPFFAFISIAGCVIGYFVGHAPLDQLGVIVSVPIVVGFLLSRLVLLALSRSRIVHHQTKHVSVKTLVIVLPVFLGLTVSTIFFVSSLIYAEIGLPGTAVSADHFATFAVGCYFVWGGLIMLVTRLTSKNVIDRLQFVVRKLFDYFWDVICIPGRVLQYIGSQHSDDSRGQIPG